MQTVNSVTQVFLICLPLTFISSMDFVAVARAFWVASSYDFGLVPTIQQFLYTDMTYLPFLVEVG
jgi:hypothetical protein